MQKVIHIIMVFAMLNVSWMAHADAGKFELKDVSFQQADNGSMVVVSGKDKAVIETVSPGIYKINGATVAIDQNDTMQAAMDKIKRAYKAGGKKNALLEQLFIQEAHAAPPLWFVAVFAGMLGTAFGRAMCERALRNGAVPVAVPPPVGP